MRNNEKKNSNDIKNVRVDAGPVPPPEMHESVSDACKNSLDDACVLS